MLPVQFQTMNGNYGFPHILLQLLAESLHLHTHIYIYMYTVYVYGRGADISTYNFKFNRSWNTRGPLISARLSQEQIATKNAEREREGEREREI